MIYPYLTRLYPSYKMDMGESVISSSVYPHMEKKKIDIFSIKKHLGIEPRPRIDPSIFRSSISKQENNNMDELIQRIDRKIAELEEEEKREQDLEKRGLEPDCEKMHVDTSDKN